jgi:RNA polymerase sigma-70 factor (ECF subfamily)
MTLQPAVAVSQGLDLPTVDPRLRAFEAVMRRHNRMLFRVARGIVRSDIEAEDVLQDAYLVAYGSLPDFRGDAQLSTWLTRIVINQALAHLRKHRREGQLFDLHNIVDLERALPPVERAPCVPDGPESRAMRAELCTLLEGGIDRLPPAFRTVFILRAVEELSVEETAACLGIPEATVRSRFFRARRQLRKALEQTLDVALQDVFRFDGARCDRIVLAVVQRLTALPAPG